MRDGIPWAQNDVPYIGGVECCFSACSFLCDLGFPSYRLVLRGRRDVRGGVVENDVVLSGGSRIYRGVSPL